MNKKIYCKYLQKYISPICNQDSCIEEAAYIFEVLFVLNQKFDLKIPDNIRKYNMSCKIEDIVEFVVDNQNI